MADRVFDFKISINLIISVGIVILTIVLWMILRKMYTKHITDLKGKKKNVVRVVTGVFKYIAISGVVLVILQINGVNVSSAIAGLGIVSTIVGLALQDVLKDVIMGVNITTENFFSVGDVVKYKDIEGVVTEFSIRTTKIKSIYDDSVTTICNRNISEIKKCGTLVDIDIPLSYDENVMKVHKVMQLISKKIADVEGVDSSEYKGAESFGESAMIYKMRLFCPPENKLDIRRAAIKIIQEELAKADIKIPYKQIDVHQKI